MRTQAKARNKPRLINLLDVATLVGVNVKTLKSWVAKGLWPEPHGVPIGTTWLYRVEIIEHYLKTGEWPDDAKFKKGEGRGREIPD